MKVRVIFSIFVRDENEMEEAAEELAEALDVEQVQFDTFVAKCEAEDASYFIETLLSRGYTDEDEGFSEVFDMYGIVVSGIRIDCSNYAKDKLKALL